MLFDRCSYKNLIICILKFKKHVAILKMLLWILGFWFWSYPLSKLLSHFHYRYNSPWASYSSFFCATWAAFFSYVGGISVKNHFSLLLIDRYILSIQQIITHKEHLQYSFWSVAIFWVSLEALAPWS